MRARSCVDRPVSGDDVIESELPNRIDRRGPRSRIPVGDVRQEADNHVTRSDHAFLRREHGDVAGGVGTPVELDMKIARGVLDHVRLGKGNGRQLQRVTLHLGLIGLQLPDQIRVAFLVGVRGRFGQRA